MRILLHLSDLHFGRTDQALIRPLVSIAHALEPHLVVVSGDLTQRARSEEFHEARAFLDALPSPQIVVPGNHDVPLHNVLARFLLKLEKFQRIITPDLEPFHLDSEIAVLGVNTARSWTVKDGRINDEQVQVIRQRMCRLDDGIVKIVVTHHPFDLPDLSHHREIVGGAHDAMKAIAACGVDVLLSGHLHQTHTGHTAKRFKIDGHSALIVQAGTATSTRARGEQNSFNILRVESSAIQVETLSWSPELETFLPTSTEQFQKSPAGWVRVN